MRVPDSSRFLLSNLTLSVLIASAITLAMAVFAVPPDYSPISNTLSEAGAQGVEGAWMARLGFILFGCAVLALSLASRRRWGLAGTALIAGFGACMIGAGVFSTRSWVPGTGFDATEDVLHSVAATVMGFCFIGGVISILVNDRSACRGLKTTGWVAVTVAIMVSVGMTALPGVDGALQRLMFTVAYLWFGAQAIAVRRAARSRPTSRP
jgi:hypothetical membrane protein